MVKQCYFKQNYDLKLSVAFKMASSSCFSLGGNLDFPEFVQKCFITSTTTGTIHFCFAGKLAPGRGAMRLADLESRREL